MSIKVYYSTALIAISTPTSGSENLPNLGGGAYFSKNSQKNLAVFLLYKFFFAPAALGAPNLTTLKKKTAKKNEIHFLIYFYVF